MTAPIRRASVVTSLGALVVVVSMIGCGGSNAAPDPPILALAGVWSGTARIPGSQGGLAIPVSWTTTQSGNAVSGLMMISNPRRATYTATLAGTINGSDVTLTETVTKGSIPDYPTCSILGTGVLSASTTSIVGSITAKYSSCEDFNLFPNPDQVVEQFTLAK